MYTSLPPKQGLYDPWFEHDACGLGVVANIKGRKSNKILRQALVVLRNMDHRGGQGADMNSGDGAGILLQLPHTFLVKECAKLDIELPQPGHYAVGFMFLPPDVVERENTQRHFEKLVTANGQELLGWRNVPVDPEVLGEKSRQSQPFMAQVFIKASPQVIDRLSIDDNAFERQLYSIRRQAENHIRYGRLRGGRYFYIASLSSRTIVYKGMLTTEQLGSFYSDLQDSSMETAMALVHSRFSTNTFPSWERAHPYRYLMHNGEINTLRGNINWMRARQTMCGNSLWGSKIKDIMPIIDETGSDSGMFDNCLEFLVMSGRSLPHAVMMMIPEPWGKNPHIDPDLKAFFEYHNSLIEAWDGPAAMAFTDGRTICAALDRNGLRPSRYYITQDDTIVLASEVGVVDLDPATIVKKDRLRPGRMLVIDTVAGRIIGNDEIKHKIATEQPYRKWLDENLIKLNAIKLTTELPKPDPKTLLRRQLAFGYTLEDLTKFLKPMATKGIDPLGAMGNDAPLAVLSEEPQLLYNYFKQLFAQVTNPPIDAIREEVFTDTTSGIGPEKNLIDPQPDSCRQISAESPVLSNIELAKLKNIQQPKFQAATLPMLYPVAAGGPGLKHALDSLCAQADAMIAQDKCILILSDREMNEEMAAIPALLAGACLHHHLIKSGSRLKASIIIESAEPREVHHFALLLGYGVSGINPYLAFETIEEMCSNGMITGVTVEQATANYIDACTHGIAKILSKMGISTVQSYRGAQIFEAVGISRDLIDKYFCNTPSPIEGLGISEIAAENALRHKEAYHSGDALDRGDFYQYHKGGQPHIIDPETVQLLQKAVQTNDYATYKKYAAHVNRETIFRLRDLLEFEYPAGCSIPIEEVESADSIVKRFRTGAMSYGALSKEAHGCIATAMNRLGSMSNTGEGGEDAARFHTEKNDGIKQVASARFGVTSDYLIHADELQIKCSQGAKPGEGGHLPENKVYPDIAKTRHATTGVALISPPPHHDIYSIEDLAELIFDLKNANRHASIGVKLTSGAGIGTISAGVVKAKADSIVVSGYDGGTGASPRTSLRHAGLPWEIGLAEVQQTLLLNSLRDRVTLEVDGKLLTGRDVAIAALFGAERFGFGTAPLLAIGCHMLRVCHLNTCPYGVCTQDEKLRKRFKGKPEYIINFMHFVAEDLREIMARLGFHTVEEMIGRYDCLKQRDHISHWKARTVNLKNLLYRPYTDASVGHHFTTPQDHKINTTLDMSKLVRMCRPALEQQKHIRARLRIKNTDRVTGTILGSEITKAYGEKGLPEDTIGLSFVGSAGQSFGAFIPHGLTLTLEGDANDYLGKGLSGGKIIVSPPRESVFPAEDNIIIGNVAFYGATAGEAYINGTAGERFCVRNSGIDAVVEGVGNHGCEYMTGGRVLILGQTGHNFAAGMSGGIAYIYDLDPQKCNTDLVKLEPLADESEKEAVKMMLEKHVRYTDSNLGHILLENWDDTVNHLTKVIPEAYEEMVSLIEKAKADGHSDEEAHMIAFEKKHGKNGKK